MNFKLLIVALLSFVAIIGISNATTPTMPSNVILNYSTITISYNGMLSYPNPFQLEISLTENSFSNYIAYNNNLANFEFFNQTGAVIPAWIESNNSGTLTIWLNLSGANKLVQTGSSSATENIYLGFASKTTNLLSNSGTIGIGEAPELSSSYGQYDDGASVFNTYLNFAGTSLPSGFISSVSSDGTFTINNGLTLGTGTSDDPTYSYLASTSNTYAPQIVEFDLASVITSPIGYGGVNNEFGYTTSQPTAYTTYNAQYFTGTDINSAYGAFTNELYSSGTEITSNSGSLTTGIFGTEINPLTFYENYNTELTSSTSITSNNYLFLGIGGPGSGAGRPEPEKILVQWFRTRAEPPNNLMPSTTFSAVLPSTPPPAVNIENFYFTPNSITYGNYPVIFYNISNLPATLNLALQNTNSIVYTFVANSLSGTQTIPQLYGAGNYIFYLEANNILSNTLTISQIPINSFSVSQTSFIYNGIAPTIVITPNTINNQIPSFSYTLTSANAGNYLVSHTFSNQNYSATTYSTNIIINKAYPMINFYRNFNLFGPSGPATFNPHNLYYITFNGISYNNQLNFSIYLNGNFIASTNSIYTYNIIEPGFYDFVMNETGNNNYFPFSNSTGFMLQAGTMNYQINIPPQFPAILSYGTPIVFNSGNTIQYTSNGPVYYPNFVLFNVSKVLNTSIYPFTANNLQQIYNFTKTTYVNLTLPVGNYLIQFSNLRYMNASTGFVNISGIYYPIEIKPAMPKFIFKLSSSAIGSVVLNNTNQTYKLYATTKELPITITANLSTIGNQLQGEVLLNGNLISTTSTTFSYTITQSNYKPNMLFEFKSNGNYNYTAFDPAFDIIFVQSAPTNITNTIQNFTTTYYQIYNGSNKIILFNQLPSNTIAKLYYGYVLPPSSQTGLYTPVNAMQYYNYNLVATSTSNTISYNLTNIPAGSYLFKLTTITNTTTNQSIVISTKNYYLTYYIERATPQFLNGVLETSNTIFGKSLKVYYNSSKVLFSKMPLNLSLEILPINKIIEFPANANISITIIPNGSIFENNNLIYNFSTPQTEIGSYSFILNGIANNNYTIPNSTYEINATISLPILNSTLTNNNIVIGSEKGFDNLTLTESDNYDVLELFEGNTLLAKSTSPLNYNLYNLISNNTNTKVIKLYAIDKSFPEINKTFIIYLYKPAYMINGRITKIAPNVIVGNVLEINFTNVSPSLVYSTLLLNLTGNQTINYEGFGNITLTMATNNNETEFISGILTYEYGNETNFYTFKNFEITQGKLKRLVIPINPANVVLINKINTNNAGLYNSIIIIAVIIIAGIIVLWKVINILTKKNILWKPF